MSDFWSILADSAFELKMFILFTATRSLAIAETARVTIRPVIAVDELTLTVTPNMTYVKFISLIELLIRGILYPVTLCQLTR